MWQHAANIIIGLIITTLAFFGLMLGVVQQAFAWLFAGAGIVVALLGIWGLVDELAHEETHEGM